MKDIINLTIKNFKLAFRTKTAIFTLLIAPILILFLLAAAFNNTSDVSINVGIYSESYTDLANTLIENLNEQSFRLVRMNSEEFCIDQVKEDLVNLCMVFPPDLEIAEGKTNEIIFHIDPSKTNLVAQVVDIISSKLAPTSKEISLNLTTNLIDRIQATTNELEEKEETVASLKDNIEKLTKHNNEIDRSITATIDLSDFKISSVTDTSNDVKDKVNILNNFLTTKIEEIRTHVTKIEDEADDIGDDESTARDNIKEEVEGLQTDVDELDSKAKSLKNDTTADFEAINTMVDGMEEKFNRIVTILGKIKQEKDASKTLLADATEQITTIDSSFSTMKASLTTISIADAENIVNPFTTKIKPVVINRSHLNLVYAGIIMMIIMFVSILLSSTMVMMERKSKSYLLNYMTPTKDISFVISQYITIMTLLIAQSIILVGISAYFFGAQITHNIPQIALTLFITLTFFVLLGMFIAYFFQAEQTITLASIALGSLFLLLSNVILPIELMPRTFQAFIKFNPFLLAESTLKRVIQFDASIMSVSKPLITLAIYSIITFFLILLVEGLFKRKGLIKFFKNVFGKKK